MVIGSKLGASCRPADSQAGRYKSAPHAKHKKNTCSALKERGVAEEHRLGILRYPDTSPQEVGVYEYADSFGLRVGLQLRDGTASPPCSCDIDAQGAIAVDLLLAIMAIDDSGPLRGCSIRYWTGKPRPDPAQ